MPDGVLFLPVTPFAPDGGLDPRTLDTPVRAGVTAGAGAVLPGCGTGEFRALSPREHSDVARTAATAADGAVPVYAGVGGALPTAVALAEAARDNGADGLLLLPPYLVKAGVRLRGLDVGAVRAPLSDPTREDLDELSVLMERGLELVRNA
ncbi:dihydrodipicolinate synthase family protein [Streptomyces sp. NPDC048484]|uniref:dihydrodipicolinate synthase family protein n=1 Tax=Streptomyces sp. NPDC048484 TaxID=3155146 RepID=UPI00343E7693